MNALEVRRRVILAQPHEAVATGAVASFRTDVISPLPMEFDLVPIQSGTGDPSPENNRPITGHDGFTRTGTGKNLLDIDALISAPSGEISSYAFKHVLVLNLEPNTKYTLSTSYSGTRLVLYFNGASQDDAVRSVTPVTKTSSATGELIIGLYNRTGIGQFEDKTVTVQLEKGESVTSYQEFGNSYSTTFPTPPGTVYGCNVRDNGDGTGTLTVDRAIVDLGDLNWSQSISVNTRFQAPVPSGIKQPTAGTITTAICESYKAVKSPVSMSTDTLKTGEFLVGRPGVNNIYIQDDRYTSKTDFENAIDGVHLVYPLATPTEYTLTMTAIQSIIGQNHVWVDNADSVSVEYWGH